MFLDFLKSKGWDDLWEQVASTLLRAKSQHEECDIWVELL
jgi:hypothetical protein